MKWLVVRLIICNHDFSKQNWEQDPSWPITIEGEFSDKQCGQIIEIPQFPGKKFEIVEVDPRLDPHRGNMPLLFVFDVKYKNTSRDKCHKG